MARIRVGSCTDEADAARVRAAFAARGITTFIGPSSGLRGLHVFVDACDAAASGKIFERMRFPDRWLDLELEASGRFDD